MKRLILLLLILPFAEFSQAQSFGKTLKETPGIVSYTYRKSFEIDVPATLDTIKGLGITNIEFSNLFKKDSERDQTTAG